MLFLRIKHENTFGKEKYPHSLTPPPTTPNQSLTQYNVTNCLPHNKLLHSLPWDNVPQSLPLDIPPHSSPLIHRYHRKPVTIINSERFHLRYHKTLSSMDTSEQPCALFQQNNIFITKEQLPIGYHSTPPSNRYLTITLTLVTLKPLNTTQPFPRLDTNQSPRALVIIQQPHTRPSIEHSRYTKHLPSL